MSRSNDGLDPSSTTDAVGGGGLDRSTAASDRTSGGLGYDDTIGSGARTGGAGRGGDQELSKHTAGGLGQDDTFGGEADTGGADSGMTQNYGMGSGRTAAQEDGGILPTEPGNERKVGAGTKGPFSGDDAGSSGEKKDGSTMDKVKGLFKK